MIENKEFCMIKNIVACLILMLLVSCGASVPKEAAPKGCKAITVPDYDGATLPCNIAPTNFYIEEKGEDYVVRAYSSGSDKDIVVGGPSVRFPVEEWHELLAVSKDDTVFTDIYVKTDGVWYRYNTLKYRIAEEADPYVTYRLIEPSYVGYGALSLHERDITNFDERVLYSNKMVSKANDRQCVNCHIPQNYNREGRSTFHVRQAKGGTMFLDGGEISKVNLKTDSTLSPGVYAAWHPHLNLVAFSVNTTGQMFHTNDLQKIEVLDFASDIILYDVDENKVSKVVCETSDFETFPAWSPDGETLYYASAHFEQNTDNVQREVVGRYKSLHYNIYSRKFDAVKRSFGPETKVLDADSLGKSAAFPRVSPDGRYLLVSMGDFGQFHVWHKSSDLYVKDLVSGKLIPLDEVNTDRSESYHTWSSNGKWILFTTRRDDSNYTRLYMAHFGPDGRAGKPFPLPHEDPLHDMELMKSYNVPEWMVRPVEHDLVEITDVIMRDAKNAVYAGEVVKKLNCEQKRWCKRL